ncbi:hypothetical protein HUT16_35260 [Kitasatospora sp. NA04385]|uniref:hypothetical protein n=1 Tax=Kitasatospora sp. NA04385 TaxID=2742135 RepID=UPI001591DA7D|nr:hypothetical protein [Kitasatospora sp. NA04385]QKW23662.1 hypothetical protein HUT16_35260 [Kitasatospora sp. NA04385]
MGLQDDVNRARAAADAEGAAELRRREAAHRAASNLWADFLSCCREFAELAPRNGRPPATGQRVLSKHRMQERGNWDHVVDNPGGWTFNVEGHMFCVTTDGTLLTEGKKSSGRPGIFPMRTRYVHRFEPCPAFPASPSELVEGPGFGEVQLPGVFRIVRSGRHVPPSEVVQRDIAKFGGAVAVSTYLCDDEGMRLVFAKDLLVDSLQSAR